MKTLVLIYVGLFLFWCADLVITWMTRSSNWRTRDFQTNRTQSLWSESTVLKSHGSSMTITESKATATTCIDLYQPVSTTESEATATTCNNLYQPVSTTESKTTATTCIDLYQPVSTTESKATATTCIDLYQPVSTTESEANNLYQLVSTCINY